MDKREAARHALPLLPSSRAFDYMAGVLKGGASHFCEFGGLGPPNSQKWVFNVQKWDALY
jgi:hypothetical protein